MLIRFMLHPNMVRTEHSFHVNVTHFIMFCYQMISKSIVFGVELSHYVRF